MKRGEFFHFDEFVRYCVGGGICFGLNVLVFAFLVELVHVWYVLASVVAFITSFLARFITHKYWTFRKHVLRDKALVRMWKFFVLHSSMFVTNIVLLYLLVERMERDSLVVHVSLTIAAVIVGLIYSAKIFKGKPVRVG